MLPFVDIEREINQAKSLVKLSVQMLSFVKVQERNFLARMMRSNTLNKGENKVVRYGGLRDMQILSAVGKCWYPGKKMTAGNVKFC